MASFIAKPRVDRDIWLASPVSAIHVSSIDFMLFGVYFFDRSHLRIESLGMEAADVTSAWHSETHISVF